MNLETHLRTRGALPVLLIFLALLVNDASAQLIGHWPLDNEATDHVSTNHGRLVAAEFTGDAKLGSHSVRFGSRAKNRAVILGNFDPSHKDLSISMWIKPHREGSGHQILMAKRQAWAKDKLRWQFVWQDIAPPRKPIPGEPYALTKEVLRFESWHDNRAEFPCKLKTDAWTHLALTHSEDSQITKCYLNGEEIKTEPQKMALGPPLEAPVVIGGTHPKDWREIFHGQIDDVGLWNVVLTQEQVREICSSAQDPQRKHDLSKVQSVRDSDKP